MLLVDRTKDPEDRTGLIIISGESELSQDPTCYLIYQWD